MKSRNISGQLIIPLLTFLILITSCKKEKYSISNLNGNKIDVMGHGGMGYSSTYPINSFESILNCLNLGASGTEFDVQLTKDNVLVAFHDENLANSTNSEGIVNSMNWADLINVVYDAAPYTTYSVISLEDLFSKITNHKDFKFSLDIKLYSENANHATYIENYTDALIALFNKYDLENHVYVESQSKDFLALLHSKKENYSLYHYSNSFQESLKVAKELGIKGMVVSNKYITSTQIEQAHREGVFVTLWDVGSKADNHNAVEKNPDMIETDKVKHLVDILHD